MELIGHTDDGDGAPGSPVYRDEDTYRIDDPDGPEYVSTLPKLAP